MILTSLVLTLAWVSADMVMTPSPTKVVVEKEKTSSTPSAVQDSEPSGFGKIISFLILFGILLVLGATSWYDQKTRKWRNFTEAMLEPVFMTLIGLAILSTLIFLMIHPVWIWLMQDWLIFFTIYTSLVIMAFLLARKGEHGAKTIAMTVLVVLIIGIGTRLYKSPSLYSWLPTSRVLAPSSNGTLTNYHFTVADMSAEEAFKSGIGGCESQGDPYATPVHWKKGEEGKTPLPNKQGSGAFGWLQLSKDKIDDAKAKGFGDIVHDKVAYDRYAIHLYNDEGGTKHWEFNQEIGGGPACWGPALQDVAVSKGTRPAGQSNEIELAVVEAEVGSWTRTQIIRDVPITNPPVYVYWESLDHEPYVVMITNDKTYETKVISSTQAVPNGFVPKRLSFTSINKGKKNRIRTFLAPKKS